MCADLCSCVSVCADLCRFVSQASLALSSYAKDMHGPVKLFQSGEKLFEQAPPPPPPWNSRTSCSGNSPGCIFCALRCILGDLRCIFGDLRCIFGDQDGFVKVCRATATAAGGDSDTGVPLAWRQGEHLLRAPRGYRRDRQGKQRAPAKAQALSFSGGLRDARVRPRGSAFITTARAFVAQRDECSAAGALLLCRRSLWRGLWLLPRCT